MGTADLSPLLGYQRHASASLGTPILGMFTVKRISPPSNTEGGDHGFDVLPDDCWAETVGQGREEVLGDSVYELVDLLSERINCAHSFPSLSPGLSYTIRFEVLSYVVPNCLVHFFIDAKCWNDFALIDLERLPTARHDGGIGKENG